MALASVTLGLLVSGLAKSGFQVIQLMLLFVVPQILLSGLFDLASAPEWMQVLSQCFPITYGVDALRAIMLRGADFASVGFDLAMIWGFIALFFVWPPPSSARSAHRGHPKARINPPPRGGFILESA